MSQQERFLTRINFFFFRFINPLRFLRNLSFFQTTDKEVNQLPNNNFTLSPGFEPLNTAVFSLRV